jgi:hypothetical protein
MIEIVYFKVFYDIIIQLGSEKGGYPAHGV